MKRAALAVVVVLVACSLGACGGSKKGTRPTQPFLKWRGQQSVEVLAEDNLFTPPNIQIDEGTKVTWSNEDEIPHNIRQPIQGLDYGSAPFGVELAQFEGGDTYSYTFDKPGSFKYLCNIHAGMYGEVRVEQRDGSSASSTTSP